jgi:lipopolysaccharide biosynthesis glycosyltransferase
MDELHVIVRTNDMTEKTINRLKKIANSKGLRSENLCFKYTKDLCDRLEKEHVVKFKNSYMCYFKLFGLQEVLDCDEKRLIVIDCDTIICDSIKKLYEYDLNGKAVGAVVEFPNSHFNSKQFGDIREFNTGVLLWDMKRYMECEIEKKLIDTISTIPTSKWEKGDQTVFSICMENLQLVEVLPLRYNFIINQTYFSYKEFAYIRNITGDYYDEEDYENARMSPCILHLILGAFVVSPWYYEGDKKIKKIWDGYISDTDWRDEKSVYIHLPLKSTVTNMVCRLIHRCVPQFISKRIFKYIFTKTS